MILKTIADVAINLYAMSAVIARCNKAKVLDLRNCDHEFMIAKAFVWNTYRVNSLMMQKLMGKFVAPVSAIEIFRVTSRAHFNSSMREFLIAKFRFKSHPGHVAFIGTFKASFSLLTKVWEKSLKLRFAVSKILQFKVNNFSLTSVLPVL